MAKTIYPVDNITGGTTSDLDGQDGANLNDGDFALVLNETGTWIYRLDGDNALPESPPDIVAPTVNAGDKRWVLRYSSVERGFVEQLNITINSSDSNHDVDIPPGLASLDNKSNSYYRPFRLSSTITKQIDANWSEGSNNGGFPSGITLSANTTYYVFIIGKTNGKIDGGFDSATDASNLLADASTYDWYRQLGYVETDGSANISIVVPQALDSSSASTFIDRLGALDASENLGDVANASNSRTNLGLGTASVENDSRYVKSQSEGSTYGDIQYVERLTQSEYDSITPDNDTLYIII